MKAISGIDFGTSNSTIGVLSDEFTGLCPIENGKNIIPSALFFPDEEEKPLFGQNAIDEYIKYGDGRFMRSLKSILGNSLIYEQTLINNRPISFADVIAIFIRHLKITSEQYINQEIDTVVMGRPVQFVDNDPVKDKQAEDCLFDIAKKIGYKYIEFQYEPVAAAITYERTINKEETALIIDIGGGTSDFSIIKLSPEKKDNLNRKNDILANGGIHIGGTDFDFEINLNKVMKFFGYNLNLKDKNLKTPKVYFHDLATWHKIPFLYNSKTISEVENLKRNVVSPEFIENFITALKDRKGHNILFEVEKSKIDLTSNNTSKIDLSFIREGLKIPVSLDEFNDLIDEKIKNLTNALDETVKSAGLKNGDIQTIFLTGGSSSIPKIKNSIINKFQNAKIESKDNFTSIGMGLIQV